MINNAILLEEWEKVCLPFREAAKRNREIEQKKLLEQKETVLEEGTEDE